MIDVFPPPQFLPFPFSVTVCAYDPFPETYSQPDKNMEVIHWYAAMVTVKLLGASRAAVLIGENSKTQTPFFAKIDPFDKWVKRKNEPDFRRYINP